MRNQYRFWLEAFAAWTIRDRVPLTDWTVRYEGQAPREHDPDWGTWVVPESRMRELATATQVPWDDAALLIEAVGEALLSVDRHPVMGINRYHQRYRPHLPQGRHIALAIEQVTTDLMGVQAATPGIGSAEWVRLDPASEAYYWDLSVLLEWADDADAPPDALSWLERALDAALSPLYQLPLDERAVRAFSFRPERSAEEEGLVRALAGEGVQDLDILPDDVLRPAIQQIHRDLRNIFDHLKKTLPPGAGELVMMGHAHIDLAWLWAIAETHRKVLRTAAGQAFLLKEYPDWRFGMSSPEMWTMLESSTQLWTRWKELIRQHRVDPLGAFWVEADSQLVGAESMLRHLIYGLRYFERVAGRRPATAFLPDTFGFSGGLPTLLAAAGIRLFLTTKINWNDTNSFPYKNFRWVGPDGSAIQAMIFGSSPDGYNGTAAIRDLKAAWQGYVKGGGRDRVLYAFGWGDGGGGPDISMLERIRRYRDLPLLPILRDAEPETLAANQDAVNTLPRYRGDLYLEYHRAVFTAQTQVKTLNRAVEADLTMADVWGVLAGLNPRTAAQWTQYLRNHFHDILPGSSIRPVYEDFAVDMEDIKRETESLLGRAASEWLPAGSQKTLVIGHRSSLKRPAGPLEISRRHPFSVYWNDAWHLSRPLGHGHHTIDIPELVPWELAAFPLREEEADTRSPSRLLNPGERYESSLGGVSVKVGPAGILSWRVGPRECSRKRPASRDSFNIPSNLTHGNSSSWKNAVQLYSPMTRLPWNGKTARGRCCAWPITGANQLSSSG